MSKCTDESREVGDCIVACCPRVNEIANTVSLLPNLDTNRNGTIVNSCVVAFEITYAGDVDSPSASLNVPENVTIVVSVIF